MPKCDFNKVAKQLRHWFSPVNLLNIFRNLFLRILLDDRSDSGIHVKKNVSIKEKEAYDS